SLAAAAFALVAFLGQPAVAVAAAADATAPSVRFGILHLDRVMQESDAATGIMSELNAKRKEFGAQHSKEEKAPLGAEADTLKQKEKMSQADFEKKRDAFERKLTNAKNMVQDRKTTLDRAFSATMSKLREEILKITAEIARDRQFDVVFSDESIILAEQAYDITDEVMARMNKEVKKVSVIWQKK